MSDKYFVRGELWFSFYIEVDDFKEAQDTAKEIVKQKIQSLFEDYEIWWVLTTPEKDKIKIQGGK